MMETKGHSVSPLIQMKDEKVPIFGHVLTKQAERNTKNNSGLRDPRRANSVISVVMEPFQ
jgi:hypothetical protein